jgi:CheY-like chemotaxis protein
VLRDVSEALRISVSDTGIGIPKDKQKLIFEAFQQADGTTSRKYGGTGLGLSISREIVALLGGELQVRSTPGEGSTFVLFVPLRAASAPALAHPVASHGEKPLGEMPFAPEPTDDRGNLGKDPFILIVEDDPAFASILLDLAHDAGLKGVISPTGLGSSALARKLQPTAITLDLGLSDMDGFVLLEMLRREPDTAAIPIHVISGGELADDALRLGAAEVIEKPASRERLMDLFGSVAKTSKRRKSAASPKKQAAGSTRELAGRRLLIVDDDIRNIYSLTSVLEARGAEILHAERGQEGIDLLEANPDIDVALIDIMMPEMDGYETMRRIRAKPAIAGIPLVAVTAKAMLGDRQKCLDAGATDYIAKPVDIDLMMALLRVTIERAAIDRGGATAQAAE